MVVSYSGIAGKRGYNPTKIVLHNDAGSQNANAAYYKKWLEGRNPELGFAHYYVASDGTFQAELDTNKAWHCGNTVGNRDYIGIEICQSNGDEATFKANEQKAFKLAYDLCKKYGIAITVDNFPLHKELSATSCPFRSFELHGRSNNAVKQYFVEQVVKAGGQVVKPTPTPSKPTPTKKSIDEIAREVIAGEWSSGQDRINKLTNAGYNAQEVQNRVNTILGASAAPVKPTLKPTDTIAKEVINGDWGSGQDRFNRLANAGYNAQQVQNRVNELLGATSKPQLKSIDTVAREVLAGQWGNGADRKARLEKAGYNYNQVQSRVNQLA